MLHDIFSDSFGWTLPYHCISKDNLWIDCPQWRLGWRALFSEHHSESNPVEELRVKGSSRREVGTSTPRLCPQPGEAVFRAGSMVKSSSLFSTDCLNISVSQTVNNHVADSQLVKEMYFSWFNYDTFFFEVCYMIILLRYNFSEVMYVNLRHGIY